MNRLTSYGFIFALIYLAILEGDASDHVMLIQGFTISLVVAYLAFFLTWLTLDATLPVIVIGTAIFGFGGWILAIAVVVFFITGSLFSRLNRDLDTPNDQSILPERRRDGLQVWANGFWAAFFCFLLFLFPLDLFLGAAFGVIATATADTWATETGIRKPGKTISIKTRKSVPPGTEGGISFKGTFFSILGALLIGFFASQEVGENAIHTFAVVSFAGFAGCLIDSYIGAVYQRSNDSDQSDHPWYSLDKDKQNSFVNWVSTGSGGLIALILLLII
ncbi:DUF92 domain-containing protein [Rhodohalobacter sp. 8-1]|uniref:DUF92 domain-containing protein n=1 Tax=Rhodohalobacter sp. 8-1 TaxID=3131972 RepID=UPI0030EEAF6D